MQSLRLSNKSPNLFKFKKINSTNKLMYFNPNFSHSMKESLHATVIWQKHELQINNF